MPLRLERSHQNQRTELIVTANVRLVRSGQHLEHNAQRQKAPAHSTPYFTITIVENKILQALIHKADLAYPLMCTTL